MPPPKPAKWSARPAEVAAKVDAKTGAFTLSAPLYDNGVRQGVLTWSMTANRQMRVEYLQDPGTAPVDFSGGAWVREA